MARINGLPDSVMRTIIEQAYEDLMPPDSRTKLHEYIQWRDRTLDRLFGKCNATQFLDFSESFNKYCTTNSMGTDEAIQVCNKHLDEYGKMPFEIM